MKKSRFTAEQIAFALLLADGGARWQPGCRSASR